MSWQILRPQIGTLLETLSTIQEVSNAPKIKFGGYPSATVTPSDNSAEYESTTENVRVYAFAVRVFYETKQTSMEDAFAGLEEVVDSVLDLFDQEDMKGADSRTVGIDLPSGYTYLNIWAAPSFWGEIPGEELLMSQIAVRVRVSVDVT